MEKKWIIKSATPDQSSLLSDTLGVDPIVAQLLVNRSISDVQEAKEFLKADLNGLHDPFLFKDMDKAVERIRLAAKNQETILVFGDYDVDGVTSSVILNKIFTKMGISVVHHIPHRMTDGYGLNHEIAEVAHAKGVTLMITIDCGLRHVKKFKQFVIVESM